MYRSILVLTVSFLFPLSLCGQATYCVVKYIPFETKFNVRLSENDFINLQQKKFLQVKYDTIYDNEVCAKIFIVLQNIKSQDYEKKSPRRNDGEIRMMCSLILNSERINFFVSRKMEIIMGDIQIIHAELIKLIFSQLCRPYYSFKFLEEEKHWLINDGACGDSLEFYKCYPR